MRILLLFCLIILLSNCATIEVAKEITKATNSISESVNKMMQNKDLINKKDKSTDREIINQEIASLEIEKEEEREIIKEQKKEIELNFLGKSFDEITLMIGGPKLTRVDGGSKTARYDNNFCKLFIFSNAG